MVYASYTAKTEINQKSKRASAQNYWEKEFTGTAFLD